MEITHRQELQFEHVWPVEDIYRTLRDARRIVLVAHTNADGDAVGSLLGLWHVLRSNTKADVTPILPDPCPDDLSWLPGADSIVDSRTSMPCCQEAIAQAEVIVGLDISGFGRTGALEAPLRAAQAKKILIDHHLGPDTEAFDYVASEPSISSTCELAYWILLNTFSRDGINSNAATCLFTGICTDTGTFTYSNDRPSVYAAAADLLAYGIDPMDINRRIKNIFTVQRLQFFGYAIAHRLEVFPDRGVALMTLTAQDMQEHQVESHELTGLINEVMRLRDIDCGILVREEEGHVRLSLRSKSVYDVNRLASDLFGGGGHTRAAGATSTLPLRETVTKVKSVLKLCCLLACFLLASCRDVPVVEAPAPQDNRVKESLISANRLTSQGEAAKIDAYVARRGWQMQQLAGGARVLETRVGGNPIEYEDHVVINYSVEDLGGNTIYASRSDTVVAGRLQPTSGLSSALLTLHYGSQAVVILPSEQAYGVVGDGDRIGSRMVLVYKLSIES